MNQTNETTARRFGTRLRQKREEAGIEIAELAQAVNLTRGAIQNYEYGNRQPRFHVLNKLAEALQCDVSWLSGLTDDNDDIHSYIIPAPERVGLASQGPCSLAFNPAELDKRGLLSDKLALFRVADDLLQSHIRSGNEVLVDISVKKVTHTAIYAVRDGAQLAFRWGRIEAGSNAVVIYADDTTHYPPIRFDAGSATVEIIGKVVGVWSWI